jgi:hypothetical protein
MSSPEAVTAGSTLAQDAPKILQLARQALDAGEIEAVPDEAVQQLLLAGVKLYFAKRDSGSRLAAFPGPDGVTASEVAAACVGMTEVVNLELFELALWAGWSNI